MDSETGLYYYGARYLDPKYSHWLSPDPAMGKYIPEAPVNDEARKHNQNLPGQGGVFNTVNLQVYHYAGNNPIKYTDPDGNFSKAAAGEMLLGAGLYLAAGAVLVAGTATVALTDGTTAAVVLPGAIALAKGLAAAGTAAVVSGATLAAAENVKENVGKNSKDVNPDDIDLSDPKTWPKPPTDSPTTEGEPSRAKPKNRGEKSLYDDKGGEWRVHKPDTHHSNWHWDYKSGENNSPWRDIDPNTGKVIDD